jgi:hypothetical protein
MQPPPAFLQMQRYFSEKIPYASEPGDVHMPHKIIRSRLFKKPRSACKSSEMIEIFYLRAVEDAKDLTSNSEPTIYYVRFINGGPKLKN